jgi:Tfp pilus assembly protein PilV
MSIRSLRSKRYNNGQSLVEVIVATAVVVLLATGLVVGTTSALRASIASRARSEGTKLVQQGLEIARHDRELGWADFQSLDLHSAEATPTYYCFSSSATSFLSLSETTNPDGCTMFTIGTVSYRRYAEFNWITSTDPDYMKVKIITKWRESSSTPNRQAFAEINLTQWK